VLVIYRDDHRFLLDPIIPRAGGTSANYDLVIASQPYRARASLDFKAKRVIGRWRARSAPADGSSPSIRTATIPAWRSFKRCGGRQSVHSWTPPDPQGRSNTTSGPPAASSISTPTPTIARLFRYEMHTLPSEISESIGTSTLFAAWNAAIYVRAGRGRPARRSGRPTAVTFDATRRCCATAAAVVLR